MFPRGCQVLILSRLSAKLLLTLSDLSLDVFSILAVLRLILCLLSNPRFCFFWLWILGELLTTTFCIFVLSGSSSQITGELLTRSFVLDFSNFELKFTCA